MSYDFLVETLTIDNSKVAAVVDTNVLFDFLSVCDLMDDYERLGADGVLSPRAIWRRARARDATLLAIYFNKTKAVTYSLHHEGLRLLMSRADPKATKSFEMHFTTFVLHFVAEYLLPDWWSGVELDNDRGAKGNQADRLLLNFAKENSLPLITNEGSTPNGITDQKLRSMAKQEGVAVFTPGEFIDGKIDEQAAIVEFLGAFRKHAPEYLARHPKREIAEESFGFLLGFYKHVLLGATQGMNEPVPVRVVPKPCA